MENNEWGCLALLLIIGAITHFLFLASPRQVVFDEVHFGKFVTAYCCTHERFFDIHPPHAKLLIAGTSYVLGYRGGFDFQYIGEAYNSISITALRFFPAIMGIILPLLFFILLKQLHVSTKIAFLGGLFVALDNAL